MQINVNMKQFKENWVWNADTVYFGDIIAKTKGSFLHSMEKLISAF